MLITIEKAIEIQTLNIKEASRKMSPDVKAALIVGVSAMKRVIDNRRDPEFDHWTPLLGEEPPPDILDPSRPL